jgi:ribosomal-protein-alanine N-acetyltransferase
MVNYAFNNAGFHSIEAVIDPNNFASEKVLLKNGFRKEAHFVENFFWNNEFISSVHYGILNREFVK